MDCSNCNALGLPGTALLQIVESVSLPLAVLDRNNHYVWCNRSYEHLVGYSLTELRKRTWMDITVSDDVAGDLASVNEIIEGSRTTYTIYKRYRHRSGEEVPIILTVWKYPIVGDVVYFLVETPRVPITTKDLEDFHKEVTDQVEHLRQQMKALEMTSRKSARNTDSQIVNVGNNATDMFRWVVAAIIVLIGGVSYLIYIGGWSQHGGEAKPPTTIEAPSE